MQSRNHTLGSTLVASAVTLSILALIAGQAILFVSSRLQTAHRSSAWNESLIAAEAGVDLTLADITGSLPDVRLSSDGGLGVAAPTLPPNILSALRIGSSGVGLSQGVTLSYEATTLTHDGEGSGSATAMVMLDVLPISSILGSQGLQLGGVLASLSNPTTLLSNGPDLSLIRIRSRGYVPLSGPRRADPEKLDARLRRVSLVWDPETGGRATQPKVSREVEVVLRPVLPFQNAVATTGRFSASSPGAVFDSFNSLTPLTSTNGLYDLAKRQRNGDLSIGGNNVTLTGYVYGDVRTGGASISSSDRITGQIDNNHSERLPIVRAPSWSANTMTPLDIAATTTVSAGPLDIPTRVKVRNVSGTLRVNRGLLNLGTNVEIWITGDVTGGIEIPAGVKAKVYVEGQVRMNAGRLVNGSGSAANLQIYGVGDDPPSGARGFEIDPANLAAAIYAPTHQIIFNGNGDFSGAVAGATFTAADAVKVHFDEGLALNVGPILRYSIASYRETTR